MKIRTDGLIIREQNIGEQDRLVTILTRENGLVRAFVKNARNIKSPKGASTRLLCYSRFVIFKGRDTYTVDEAQTQEMFVPLRSDVVKMSLAQYFCELAMYFVAENMQSEMYLRLFLNALYILSKGTRPLGLVKAATELRLLSIAGYMPDLVCCAECKSYEDENMHFMPKRGILICSECIKQHNKYADEYKINTGIGVTTAMRHCIYAPFEKLFSFNLPQSSVDLLERVSEEYMVNICERVPGTLDFYKAIK